MKVVVTGGAGYLGYDLVQLLDKNPRVNDLVIYDNLAAKNLSFLFGTRLSKTTFIEGDILDSVLLQKVVEGADVVFHLAAYVWETYGYNQSLQFDQINKWGTLSLIRCMNETQMPQRLIYISSVAVYPFEENLSLVNQEPAPSNPYGKSKLDGEKYCQALNSAKDWKIVRLGNVFGYNPCFRRDSVINNFIVEASLYNRIKIFGDGSQFRPFLHVSRAARFLAGLTEGENSQDIETIFDFCANVNDIKEVMMESFKDMEFVYLNLENKAISQLFPEKVFADENITKLKEEIEKFKNSLRIGEIN